MAAKEPAEKLPERPKQKNGRRTRAEDSRRGRKTLVRLMRRKRT